MMKVHQVTIKASMSWTGHKKRLKSSGSWNLIDTSDPSDLVTSRLYMSNGQNYLLEEMDTGHLGRPYRFCIRLFRLKGIGFRGGPYQFCSPSTHPMN